MRALPSSRPWARLGVALGLAAGLLVVPGGAAPLAAPPAPLPPGRDTTVPLGPPVAVQTGGQTVQAAPIARTTAPDGREAVADRVIVGFKPGVGAAEQDAVHRAVASARAVPAPVPLKRVGDNAQYVDVAGAPSLDAAIRAYRADPRVRYAEPDYLVRPAGTPNDPSFPLQYGMAKIRAPAAWDATHGALSVEVAVLDCGVYEAHPDLAGKVVARQDFTGSPYGTDDKCNHGTHVAGIVGADTGNGVGVAGVGYDTALMNGKVLLEQYDSAGNPTASGSSTWIASGIRWATDNGAKVISMSLGSPYTPAAGSALTCSQTFQDAVDYATARNVVVVAAAGNDGANELFQPASCAGVISVASTDQNDARSGFSNYGAWVSVAAPGSAILSTVNPALNANAAYAYFSGTSMATPHVAGLAALLWATGWGASAQAVAARILATADPIAGATGLYWQTGRIDAARAVAGPPPAATGLSPASLPAGGGPFTLTVTGSNFVSGAVVRWNGASRPTAFASGGKLTAAIPASDVASAGSASVTVANPDGGVTAAALTFAITASPPRPTGIAPSSGSANGGTTVTMSGGYFRAGASVRIGGVAARVQSVTDTTITATTPAHAPGTVDVVVTNPDGQSGTLAAAFTYTADPLPPSRPQPSPAATGTPAPLPPARPTAATNGPAAANGSPAPLPSRR